MTFGTVGSRGTGCLEWRFRSETGGVRPEYSRFLGLMAGLVLVGMQAGCRTAVGPTPQTGLPPSQVPPPALASLAIEASSFTLDVGSRKSVSAVRRSGGLATVVTPIWSTDNPTVVTVDPGTPSLLGSGIGRTAIHAEFEDLRAEATVIVVPVVRGRWEGRFRYTKCERVKGDGPSVCRLVVGASHTLSIVLEQSDGRLSGPITLLEVPPLQRSLLSGAVTDSGVIVLASTQGESDAIEIENWQSTIGEKGEMNGTFDLRERFVSFYGSQELFLTCELLGVRRTDL